MPTMIACSMISIRAIVALAWLFSLQLVCSAEYGVDVSYPMHHAQASTNYDGSDPSMPFQPLGDKQAAYIENIEGCVQKYGIKGERCWDNEYDRIAMNLRQPQSMRNFTKMGFTKIRAPERVFQLIKDFWDENRDAAEYENWPAGNTYVNHWHRRSKMVSVENPTLKGGGYVLKSHIWNAARDTISEWTGQELSEVSLYGIRIYEGGAVLAPHVDRLPLVSSAIINVDQDVDEPWPLEVIGHDGKAYNVTMEPGDLVLYESHTVIHGRQFPLKGRFMANVFIHFEPIGPLGGASSPQGGLPPYLIPGSPDEQNWRNNNPDGWHKMDQGGFVTGTTEAHRHALHSDYSELHRVLESNQDYANAKDENGWTPLHIAVREESAAVVELLVERGADVNAVTKGGQTALNIAREEHGTSAHPVVKLLESLGARDAGPEL